MRHRLGVVGRSSAKVLLAVVVSTTVQCYVVGAAGADTDKLGRAVDRSLSTQSYIMTILGDQRHAGVGDKYVYERPRKEAYLPADPTFPAYVVVGDRQYFESEPGSESVDARELPKDSVPFSRAMLALLKTATDVEQVNQGPMRIVFRGILPRGSGQFSTSRPEPFRVVVSDGRVSRASIRSSDAESSRRVVLGFDSYDKAPQVVAPRTDLGP